MCRILCSMSAACCQWRCPETTAVRVETRTTVARSTTPTSVVKSRTSVSKVRVVTLKFGSQIQPRCHPSLPPFPKSVSVSHTWPRSRPAPPPARPPPAPPSSVCPNLPSSCVTIFICSGQFVSPKYRVINLP